MVQGVLLSSSFQSGTVPVFEQIQFRPAGPLSLSLRVRVPNIRPLIRPLAAVRVRDYRGADRSLLLDYLRDLRRDLHDPALRDTGDQLSHLHLVLLDGRGTREGEMQCVAGPREAAAATQEQQLFERVKHAGEQQHHV